MKLKDAHNILIEVGLNELRNSDLYKKSDENKTLLKSLYFILSNIKKSSCNEEFIEVTNKFLKQKTDIEDLKIKRISDLKDKDKYGFRICAEDDKYIVLKKDDKTIYKIFKAESIFRNSKYPDIIIPGYCFENCYNMVACSKILDMKVITGIAQLSEDEPYLHSVLEKNVCCGDESQKYIIDFNMNIMMPDDLYYKLFSFQILNIVDEKVVKNDRELIHKGACAGCNFPISLYNLTNKELILKIKKVLLGESEPFTAPLWKINKENNMFEIINKEVIDIQVDL